MNTEKTSSLRSTFRKMIIILTLQMIITFTCILLIGLYFVRQGIIAEQTLAVDTLARQGNQYLLETEYFMHVLAHSLIEFPFSYQTKVLLETQEHYPRFSSLYLLDAKGIVIAETPSPISLINMDFSGEPYFQKVQQSPQPYFSEPFISTTHNLTALTIVVPTFSASSFRGALVGELDLAQLQHTVEQFNANGLASLSFLTDQNGTVIVHPQQQWVQERRNLGNLALVKAGMQGKQEFLLFYDQGEWLMGSVMLMRNGWIVVTTEPVSVVARPIIIMLAVAGFVLGITLLLLLFIQKRLLRDILKPISILVQKANALARGQYEELTTHQLGRVQEVISLGEDFTRMVNAVQERDQHLAQTNAELREASEKLEIRVQERTIELARANAEISELNQRLQIENLRMGAELEVTRKLQQMVLPSTKELEQIAELDIVGFMEPAAEVGGDYYDVLQHEGAVKIGIGDVTGHGLESGVLMLMVQMAVRTLLTNNVRNPSEFLTILNRVVFDNVKRMKSDKNLTLVLLDYKDRVLRLSGQHEEVLLVRNGGEVERIDTFNLGFMIGVEPNIETFVDHLEIQLYPGDGIVLYTDGIIEARNQHKIQYGIQSLCAVIRQHWHCSATEIQQAVIQNVHQHIGTAKVFDDITLVVIKQK